MLVSPKAFTEDYDINGACCLYRQAPLSWQDRQKLLEFLSHVQPLAGGLGLPPGCISGGC